MSDKLHIIKTTKEQGRSRDMEEKKQGFKPIKYKPVFVNTKNVRNFETMMDFFSIFEDTEGCFGMVYSRAGRGKTRTAQWYAAHNSSVFLRIDQIWKTSEISFLQALAKELEIVSPPGRKATCFSSIIHKLFEKKKVIILDEIEKLPNAFLEIIRDISDTTGTPFILIGEEEIVPFLQRNRRIWSRTYYKLKFEPIDASDVTLYFLENIGIHLEGKITAIFHRASEGDFRLVKRYLISSIQIMNANRTYQLTKEMAKVAIQTGLEG